jgi:hypothetical protein
MSDERPIEEMSLAEVQAELRRITGLPWASDADGPRRKALWRRLDQLVAKGGVAAEGRRRSGSDPRPPPRQPLLPRLPRTIRP